MKNAKSDEDPFIIPGVSHIPTEVVEGKAMWIPAGDKPAGFLPDNGVTGFVPFDTRWSEISRNDPSLTERLFMCPKCCGAGGQPGEYDYTEYEYSWDECKHCHGSGARFWRIEIVWKKLYPVRAWCYKMYCKARLGVANIILWTRRGRS